MPRPSPSAKQRQVPEAGDPYASLTDAERQELHRMYNAMTPLQQKFAEARLHGLPEISARRYALENTGQEITDPNTVRQDGRLYKNPLVNRYIALATKAALRKALVSREDVISGLLDAVDAAGSATELVAAWREIGKVIGAYEPERFEVTVSAEDLTRERLTTMTTQQLIELTQRADGNYVLPAEKDQQKDEFAVLSAALEPPKPVASDG